MTYIFTVVGFITLLFFLMCTIAWSIVLFLYGVEKICKESFMIFWLAGLSYKKMEDKDIIELEKIYDKYS